MCHCKVLLEMQGLTHLKKEIAEFKRQKEEETVRFEEYKKEEIRKLK